MPMPGTKPPWLTFDCYGTLIQWDEGLVAAVEAILAKQKNAKVDAPALIQAYDKYEHEFEGDKPHRLFRDVAASALKRAMEQLGLSYMESDIEILTGSISKMPPFPEVPSGLRTAPAQRRPRRPRASESSREKQSPSPRSLRVSRCQLLEISPQV